MLSFRVYTIYTCSRFYKVSQSSLSIMENKKVVDETHKFPRWAENVLKIVISLMTYERNQWLNELIRVHQ